MPVLSNRTNIRPATISAYEGMENAQINNMKVVILNFLTLLRENKKFLPNSWVSAKTKWCNAKINTPPKYVVSVKERNYRTNTTTYEYDCRDWYKWFKKKRWCRTGWHYYTTYEWTVDLNYYFTREINVAITTIGGFTSELNELIFNTCSNVNTLLNSEGLQQCGYKNTVDESQNLASEKNKISQRTMSQIKNTDDYPQYRGANNFNDRITSYNNWNFTDKINSQYPDYNYQYGNLKSLITTRNNFLNNSYDNCSVPQTSLTSTDNSGIPVPQCVSDPYKGAMSECNKAYQLAQTNQYGSDKLFDLWTDVSNSIPGNTIGANKTILNNASGSCKKWVEMFNMWQKKEDAAIAAPCIPERPITSKSDDTIDEIVTNFTNSSNERIANLNKRIDNLKNKFKHLPNILQFSKDNILETTYGMDPTVVIKNNTTEFGVIPTQSLEMIIPTGKDGIIGTMGISGVKGLPGSSGPIGKEGPMGNPTLPF